VDLTVVPADKVKHVLVRREQGAHAADGYSRSHKVGVAS
jgi:thiamine pyrophosphate-dependent acetolactate synthase large subunit-like protein